MSRKGEGRVSGVILRGTAPSTNVAVQMHVRNVMKRESPEDETASGLPPQRLAAPEGVCSRGRPEELP